MYQFYYSDKGSRQHPKYKQNLSDIFTVTAIRPTMWEEHCLECSAPLCYQNCLHYEARSDGRCKRFANGIEIYQNQYGCCGQGVRVKYRKWANMMTILFPAMLPVESVQVLTDKNQKLGEKLEKIAHGHLPIKLKWESIRTFEFLRRRKLRGISGLDNQPDAFVFHGYSFEKESYHLIIEVYDDHTPVFKTALELQPGENIFVLDKSKLNAACWTENYLVKIYPENNLEVELDILWCDFVQGKKVPAKVSAPTVKCVVWDLDNTLWNGTLIETDNLDSLELNPKVLEIIKSLDERGIIQSIASKNDYDAAWPIVEKLGIAEYFLYPQIHWNAKSSSMEQIAKSLNIGIDALALIDDSVFEREQVRSMWPQVRTYDVTETEMLLGYPEFDVLITEESKKRREMYQAEEKRNQLKANDNTDIITFLKKCNLQMTLFYPETDEERLRCYELLIRTNQLNMSGKKYTREEFDSVFERPEHRNFAFSCEDNFGTYGIVGFGQYKIEKQQIVFTEFAMSCRVAGKYIESALFNVILENEHCESGIFKIQKTKKNVLLRRTLEEIGFYSEKQEENVIFYKFTKQLVNKKLVNVIHTVV